MTHTKILHGRCPTCGHYGDDCTGSAAKHTPGPWVVDYETSEDGPLIWSENPEKQIAQTFDGPNARLIAAAPDLLAALENLASLYRDEFENDREIDGGDFLQDFADVRPTILALIAKVSGHE